MKKIISTIIIICIIIIGFIAYKSMTKPTVKANATTLMHNSSSSNTQKTDTSNGDNTSSSTNTSTGANTQNNSSTNTTTTNTQSQSVATSSSSNVGSGQNNGSINQGSAKAKMSKNTGFIILSSTPFNKFATYNGPHTWIYNLKDNKLVFSGSGCGKGMPIYVSDKILATNNGVQETWYKINFQVGMQSLATGYIQSDDLLSNLIDISTVNPDSNLNLKTGVNSDDLQLINQMQKKATTITKGISGEWHPTQIVGHQPISTGKTLNDMGNLIISPTSITFNGTTVNNPNYIINNLTASEFFNEYNCSLSKIDPNTNSIVQITAPKSYADILIKSSTELIINSGGVFFEYQK